MYLWELLISAKPFNETEKVIAESMVRSMDIEGLILYSKKCFHMNQEVCDKLIDYLDFIFGDPLNGFLLDMIIEYFTEL